MKKRSTRTNVVWNYNCIQWRRCCRLSFVKQAAHWRHTALWKPDFRVNLIVLVVSKFCHWLLDVEDCVSVRWTNRETYLTVVLHLVLCDLVVANSPPKLPILRWERRNCAWRKWENDGRLLNETLYPLLELSEIRCDQKMTFLLFILINFLQT